MGVTRTSAGKAVAVAVPTIVFLVSVVFFVSYLVTIALGLPASLDLPPVVRFVGVVFVVAGLALAGWVFRYRSPVTMMVSTYVTFTKLFQRVPMAEQSGRIEPLVIVGPQKYVRNPLYLGVIDLTFGWGLASASGFVLLGSLLLLLWFRLILIPLEERELRALFGEQYRKYSDEVPMLVPFTKRKR
jgi:protein-S-isoprenylcysteine O-methyltransferase Ste14